MPRFIKTSFAAGELSEGLSGRVDLAKYTVGASVMRNFFVDARGGASNRPGFMHVGALRLYNDRGVPERMAAPYVVVEELKPRLIPFVFSTEEAYGLEFFGSKMRVIYRGSYVVASEKPLISNITNANPAVVTTTTPHGLVEQDHIYIEAVEGMLRTNGISGVNGRNFLVGAVLSPTTFSLKVEGALGQAEYVSFNTTGYTAYTGSGRVEKIYEINTPYSGSDLYNLKYDQIGDVLTLVSPEFQIHEVHRLGTDQWEIIQPSFGSAVAAPTGILIYAVSNDPAEPQYQYAYVVTAVDDAGRESVASTPSLVQMCALDQTSNPNKVIMLQWPAVSGAYKYRIYKAAPVPWDLRGPGPFVYGLVGQSFANKFVDVNYAAEYTQGPPVARNPFLDNGIAAAIISDPGSGYLLPRAVITSPNGSGAVIGLTSDTSETASPYGGIASAVVISGGTDYDSPVLSVVDDAPLGSGLVVAFSGAWIANPLGTGFVPAPGSITITNGGANYHQGTYTSLISAKAGNQVGTNTLPVAVVSVVNGVITTLSFAPSDITPVNTTGLSSTGTGDTITFTYGTDTAGTGAIINLTVGGGSNPSAVGFLQQRRVFAGMVDNPSTFHMSRTGQLSNFDVSDPLQSDDAITGTIYANQVNIIHSLVSVKDGLIALTSGGAFLIRGNDNAGVTPSTVQADPQAFSGAQQNLTPLRVGDQILYGQALGSAIRAMEYNVFNGTFSGQDVSVLSSHLFEGQKIRQWAWAEEPHKLVWAVRNDGVLLSCTYLKEQEVYGWARHDTAGAFSSIISIPEGRESAVYVIVERYRPGYPTRYFVERLASRNMGANPAAGIPATTEEAFFVDGSLEYALSYPPSAVLRGAGDGIGVISSASIVTGGTGYTAPVAAVRDPTGSGATVTVTQTAGVITSVTIVDPGEGYTAPMLVISDPIGAGAMIALEYQNRVLLTVENESLFDSGSLGKVVRLRGGKGAVVQVVSPTQAVVDFEVLPVGLPNVPRIAIGRVNEGEWTMTAPVSVIGGLDHLNTAIVQIVVDGNVQTPKVVVDGCVTLDSPGSRIVAGQGYTCQLRPMRIETAQPTSQGSRRLIPNGSVRVKDTRGLQIGPTWEQMREIKMEDKVAGGSLVMQHGGEQLPAAYPDAPIGTNVLHTPDQYAILPSDWNDEASPCIMQSYPLPATVLALAFNVTNGDDLR